MSTIGQETSTLEKVLNIALGLLFVAFLVSVPFMIRDKQARIDKAWSTKGCQMYDDAAIKNVPAKCQGDFIDHYSPQELRYQPNNESEL